VLSRAGVALSNAIGLLTEKVEKLETRVREGDETALRLYVDSVRTLAGVIAASHALAPSEPLLTTRQLAERLQVSAKTIRKLKREGRLRPVQQLAKRGLSANRWASP